MARSKRGIQARPRRTTPAQRSRRFSDNQLQSPTIDWANAPPEQFRFPDIADLVNLTPEELTVYLERFGIKEPWPQMRMSTVGYVSRMTNITDPDIFMEEVSRLLDIESKRGALSMTRRAYRELSTIDALDGDVSTELIWISDGDDGTCERCGSRGGDIGTIQYHAAKGLPGPGVCLGGDMCRCQLVPIA